MNLNFLLWFINVKINLNNVFLSHRETSQNQGLLKINVKTLDNAYLTIVYLQAI